MKSRKPVIAGAGAVLAAGAAAAVIALPSNSSAATSTPSWLNAGYGMATGSQFLHLYSGQFGVQDWPDGAGGPVHAVVFQVTGVHGNSATVRVVRSLNQKAGERQPVAGDTTTIVYDPAHDTATFEGRAYMGDHYKR